MSLPTTGLEVSSRSRAWRDAVELLSSMRFAISLLSVLAIASVIGTVLKQNEPMPNYVNQFGPFWYEIFGNLGLYGIYSTWWFILILALYWPLALLPTLDGGPADIWMRGHNFIASVDRVLRCFLRECQAPDSAERRTQLAGWGIWVHQ